MNQKNINMLSENHISWHIFLGIYCAVIFSHVPIKALLKPKPIEPSSTPTESLSDLDTSLAIERIQPALQGYIASITSHGDDGDDILQETNLFLWERKGDFEPGSNFKAWAFKVAYYKALGSRRDKVRRGECAFSEELTQRIATGAEAYFSRRPDKFAALEACLRKLKPEEHQLLQQKYFNSNFISDYARRTGQSAGTALRALSRIRFRLKSCIEQQLSKD